MKTVQQEDRDTLVRLIDSYDLESIVMALSEIAELKAEHIRSNWQDHSTAGAWSSAGRVLDIASADINV